MAHPLVAELVQDGRFGSAREVTLRAGARTGERLVVAHPSTDGVVVPDDVRVIGTRELKKGRRAWYHEEAAGRRWRISATSFFQVRPDGAEALVDLVAAAVTDLAPEDDDGRSVLRCRPVRRHRGRRSPGGGGRAPPTGGG
ncbi:MAG: hypothetical protein WKF43_07790 [Acidimicrobiales bacterium]